MASRAISRLNPQTTALFVCDMQETLRTAISYFSEIATTSKRLFDTAKILKLKTVVTEDCPYSHGPVISELEIDSNSCIFEKTQFSMIIPEVEPIITDLKNVILVGVETHACILQTAYDLLERDIGVHIVVDAVGSRSLTDRKFALKQMEQVGAVLTTSECVILSLLGRSDHPKFEEVKKLILEPSPDVGLVRGVANG